MTSSARGTSASRNHVLEEAVALLAVLGMHRSGTSLVAGMLRALGWDVGPDEDLMPPKPDNPRGFVEHLPAVRVNDRLLYRLGGSWKDPPAMAPGWEHNDGLDDLRDEAAGVAERLTARSERVLFKDPRLSLTLPFWQTVVDIEQAVLVLRPPRPVVRSLLRRNDGLDSEGAAELYVHYLLSALGTDVRLRTVAPETLLMDPERELATLGTALGRQPDQAELEAAQRHVESELWGRSSRQREDEDVTGPLLETAIRLHDLVTGRDGPDWRDVLGRLTTIQVLDRAARQHEERTAQLRLSANELRQRLAGLRENLDEVREHRQRLGDMRDRLRSQLDRMRDELDAAQNRIAELEQVQPERR